MTQTSIYPVILCGGSGTRLWPLSRKSYPKQFARILGEETLFQTSARRVSGGNDAVRFHAPVIVTNADFRFIAAQQLQAVGIDPGPILIEPSSRNTAPALLAAAMHLQATDPDAVMLVVSSDQVMPDVTAFQTAVSRGMEAVRQGDLVTFGITPTHAETAYGYLELSAVPDTTGAPVKLSRFVEKPDAGRAAEMLGTGRFLWNAGIFLFAVSDFITAFDAHAQNLITPVKHALDAAVPDLGFLRLAPQGWDEAEDISIDYAVMERANNLSVVPYEAGWSDLGGWDAIWRESGPDEAGVVTSDRATAIECRNTLLRAESDNMEVVGIGLENVMAVAMPDAVLVADMSRAQDVKKAVAALKSKGAAQATQFPKEHRPWGWFESLVLGERFQVKRILVNPGASLSLQSHFHRSEHWIVVEGTAKVTIDQAVTLVTENQSVYIPLGSVHRLENPGKVPMVLIEVQTGTYVGEDDIVRYEDMYARK